MIIIPLYLRLRIHHQNGSSILRIVILHFYSFLLDSFIFISTKKNRLSAVISKKWEFIYLYTWCPYGFFTLIFRIIAFAVFPIWNANKSVGEKQRVCISHYIRSLSLLTNKYIPITTNKFTDYYLLKNMYKHHLNSVSFYIIHNKRKICHFHIINTNIAVYYWHTEKYQERKELVF